MKICRDIVVLFFLSLVPLVALAQDSSQSGSVEVVLRSGEELKSAYGLVIVEPSEGSVMELPQARTRNVELSRVGKTAWKAVVRVIPEDFVSSAKLTVVATTVSGATVSGPVRWLAEMDERTTLVQAKCRSLDDLTVIRRLLGLKPEKLKRVVKIREQKVDLLRSRLARILSPQVLEILNKFEQALSIKREPAISTDLPLEELASRIGAIAAISKQ